MAFRVRRKLVCDSEFLALPPSVREAFVGIFRELAVSETPVIRGRRFFVDELRQRQRIFPEGMFSVHVEDPSRGNPTWRGVFFRRGGDLVFFGFGPRVPDFYVRMDRAREALTRPDDER